MSNSSTSNLSSFGGFDYSLEFGSRSGGSDGAWELNPEALYHAQLQGDFYREEDNVTRGCTLVLPSMEATPFRVFHAEDEPMMGNTCKGLGNIALHKAAVDSLQFSDLLPPPVVEAARFSGSQRLATSLLLAADSPAEVAKTIQQFLQTQVTSIIGKVSPEKFSMKADVFQEVNCCPTHCMLKVRVLQGEQRPGQGQQVLLIEFCRRKGDALAFQMLFHQAEDFLLNKFAPASAAPRDAHLTPMPLLLPNSAASFAATASPLELTPLLAMLKEGDRVDEETQAQQAEALAALKALATWSTTGAATCCAALEFLSPPGILASCICSCSLEVSFLASCLASTLAEKCGADRPMIYQALQLLPAKTLASSCAAGAKRVSAAA
mmetsp:Transcript_98840/g.178438  ORF Transcript_98840/g.178438 Transcript_98840/m.178438 type:complete len:379 (-) Transcript_98840:586-1722(-)